MCLLSAIIDVSSFPITKRFDVPHFGVSCVIARIEARHGAPQVDSTARSMTLTNEGRWPDEQTIPWVAALDEVTTSATLGTTATRSETLVVPTRAQIFFSPRHRLRC